MELAGFEGHLDLGARAGAALGVQPGDDLGAAVRQVLYAGVGGQLVELLGVHLLAADLKVGVEL